MAAVIDTWLCAASWCRSSSADGGIIAHEEEAFGARNCLEGQRRVLANRTTAQEDINTRTVIRTGCGIGREGILHCEDSAAVGKSDGAVPLQAELLMVANARIERARVNLHVVALEIGRTERSCSDHGQC